MGHIKTPIFVTGGTSPGDDSMGVSTGGMAKQWYECASAAEPASNSVTFVSKGMTNIRPYKYSEDKLIAELLEYVKSTYSSHYADENNFQALDAIIAAGHGEGFTIGNVQKYSFRYGKKNGRNRDDLLKVLHYTLLALNIHDQRCDSEERKKPYPPEEHASCASARSIPITINGGNNVAWVDKAWLDEHREDLSTIVAFFDVKMALNDRKVLKVVYVPGRAVNVITY